MLWAFMVMNALCTERRQLFWSYQTTIESNKSLSRMSVSVFRLSQTASLLAVNLQTMLKDTYSWIWSSYNPLIIICLVMQRVSETGISAFFYILFCRIVMSSKISLSTWSAPFTFHSSLISISAKLPSARPEPLPSPSPTTLLCKSSNIPY